FRQISDTWNKCRYKTLVLLNNANESRQQSFCRIPGKKCSGVHWSCLLEILHCIGHSRESVYAAELALDAFVARRSRTEDRASTAWKRMPLAVIFCRHSGERMSAV